MKFTEKTIDSRVLRLEKMELVEVKKVEPRTIRIVNSATWKGPGEAFKLLVRPEVCPEVCLDEKRRSQR